MKKLISIVFYLLLLLIVFLRSAYAQESASGQGVSEEESVEEEVIEEEDIDKLVIDESKEPPAEKVVPIPTPMPQKEENKEEEKKAWEEFKYNSIIQKVSERYNIDPQLIYATIMTESEGDEYAFRYEPAIKDASLCMGQILISTARSLGFSGNPLEMYKPDVCIELIGKYHRKMLDEYGELTPLQLAAAYNTGSPWKQPVWGHLFRFEKWFYETVKG